MLSQASSTIEREPVAVRLRQLCEDINLLENTAKLRQWYELARESLARARGLSLRFDYNIDLF